MSAKQRSTGGKVASRDLLEELRRRMGNDLVSAIYRERVKPLRTRSFDLKPVPRGAEVAVMNTLLGIELKIGRRRILCPDQATARYLAVFARLGVESVAVPYDITQIAKLAGDLEEAFSRMLFVASSAAANRTDRVRTRVVNSLLRLERDDIVALGAGPAVPEFNQNTRQRKPKNR